MPAKARYNYSNVPASAEIDNTSKYTVNTTSTGKLLISKVLCALLVLGAILLALLAALAVYFLVPQNCHNSTPEALTRVTVPQQRYVKLPDKVLDPLHYRLQMILDIPTKTTSGSVTIRIKTLTETSDIILNSKDLDIIKDNTTVRSAKSGRLMAISSQELYPDKDQFRISLGAHMQANVEYIVEIRFSGVIGQNNEDGVVITEFMDAYSRNNKSIVFSQTSPLGARKIFPCFDEPSYKSSFEISIGRPNTLKTLSNMATVQVPYSPQSSPDFTWDQYAPTPRIPTYLVSFLLHDLYQHPQSTSVVKLWTRSHLVIYGTYAVQVAPKIIAFYEQYFNISRPFGKIDLVALPGADFEVSEYPGIIYFNENLLLFNQNSSSIFDKRQIALNLAKNIGLQWFGNTVSPKNWNDYWLYEGLATYLQYLAVDSVEPDWLFSQEFIMYESVPSLYLDGFKSTPALDMVVDRQDQIRNVFEDGFSHSKGSCILRMLNNILGAETFKKGLQQFLIKFKDHTATVNDFYQTLEIEAIKNKIFTTNTSNFPQIIEPWVQNPGFPVIFASVNPDSNKLTVHQKRFLVNSNSQKETTENLWWVPISISTDVNPVTNETKPTIWLKNNAVTEVQITFNHWYLLNLNQTGYYIVNYDDKNWRNLIDAVLEIPPESRAMLITSAMQLSRAGLLDYDIPLRLISRMAQHDNVITFLPFLAAFRELQILSENLETTPAYGLFEDFHMFIFDSEYRRVEMKDLDGIEDDYYLPRSVARSVLEWKCLTSRTECSNEAISRYRNWINGQQGGLPIPTHLRNLIVCVAIRDGTKFEWDFALDQYLRGHKMEYNNALLDGMGCTKEPWLLSKYLNIIIKEKNINKLDAERIFKSVSNNKIATSMVFDFLKKHWNTLIKRYGDVFLSKCIRHLPRHMNTETQLSELHRFKDSFTNYSESLEQAINFAIDLVEEKVQWMKNSYESIEKFLTSHKHHYDF